jgi:hypothetical protein
MRPKLALIGLGAFFLILSGLRPDTLPYIRSEARFSDAVIAHWPNALFLRESLLIRHEFPLWRETTLAGQPFAANPLNKTAYPLQWLILLLPPTLHLEVLIIVHLLLAGSGMWVWARSLGLRSEALILSTVAYAFAPRLFGHLAAGHLDIVYALAWWPWLMWSVKKTVALPTPRVKWIMCLGIISALTLIADIRVSLFAFLTTAVYAFIEARRVPKWKSVLTLIPAGLLTVGLCLDLLVPLALWQSYVNRASLTVEDAGTLSVNPVDFLGLVIPPTQINVETMVYLGIPVLFLAVIGMLSASRSTKWLLLAGFGGIALYALGVNNFIWPTLVKSFPVLLWFRVPARVWLIVTFLTPLLAGYGLQWLLQQIEAGFQAVTLVRMRLLLVGWGAITLLMGIFAMAVMPSSVSGIVLSLVGLVLVIAVFLAVSGRLRPRLFSFCLVGLTVVDLSLAGYRILEWRGTDYWLDPHRELAERLVELKPERVYSPTYSLEQQVAELYHLHVFGGVDPFQISGVVEAIGKGAGIKIENYEVVVPPLTGIQSDLEIDHANRDAVIDTVSLGQWHVSHVVAPYQMDNPRLQLIEQINGNYIYANLDYIPSQALDAVPNWPDSWPDLPDNTTVSRLNQITQLTYLISGLGWVIFGGGFLILLRLKWND